MKLLVVSNLYPPHALGGYEERCRTVVQALRARGHTLTVVTSAYGVTASQEPDADGVIRGLVPVGYFGFPWVRMPHLARIEAANHALLRRCAARSAPDAIWCWNMGGLGKSLLTTAAAAAPLVTDLSDHWVLRGIPGDPWLGWVRRHRLLGGVCGRWWGLPTGEPGLGRVYATSRALAQLTAKGGFPALADAPIIYCGIDVDSFAAQAAPRQAHEPLRCLYVGRLHPDKGVHTACAAIAATPGATLTVAGSGDPAYTSTLQQTYGSHAAISFVGRVAAHDVPALMARHHALIFPSEWEEPFALTPLEAAAAGLAIVGTTTGGSGEFLVHEQTALTYPAGEVAAASAAIARLRDDAALGARLSAQAKAEVSQRFTARIMIDRIEAFLQESVAGAAKDRR